MLHQLKKFFKRVRGDENLNAQIQSVLERLEYLENFLQIMHNNPAQMPQAINDFRLLQKASVVLLKRFTDFLDAEHIEYWLDFGTLLGAVRHGGFVPWDDDLDISMTYDSFLRLREVIPAWNTKEQTTDEGVNCRCVFYENTPLQLDIFPYYQHAENILPSEQELKKLSKKWEEKFSFALAPFETREDERGKITKYWVCADFKKSLDIFYRDEILGNKAAAQDGFLTYPWWNGAFERRVFIPYDKIFPLQKIKFEGLEFFAPRDPDFILRGRYGDYLSIPKGAGGFRAHSVSTQNFHFDEIATMRQLIQELPQWNN